MVDRLSISVRLSGLPSSMNSRFKHWSEKAKEVKYWRRLAMATAWPSRPPRPLVNCELYCVRYSSGVLDYDNLVSTFKAVIDGLKDAGVIWNDGPKIVVRREYRQAKAEPRAGHIIVVVIGDVMTEEQLRKENEAMAKKAAKKKTAKKTAKKKSTKSMY